MAIVEILDVRISPQTSRSPFEGSLDSPTPGSTFDVYAIPIKGWVFGAELKAVEVRVVHDRHLARTIYVNQFRSDVAEKNPGKPHAGNSGFSSFLGVLGLAPEFELSLRAELADKTVMEFATIRGRHRAVESGFLPTMQPLMVTSLGRSGSTWLMQLLAEHPGIVTERTYPYETRCANYWMHVLKVLAEPANPEASANQLNFLDDVTSVGHHPFHQPPITNDPRIHSYFGRSYPERLAWFCQSSIERFYHQIAATQNHDRPVYFAEKCVAGRTQWMFFELYPGAREIILVRDFRDVVCSVLAFNAKRGYDSFGREVTSSDEEFILYLKKMVRCLLDSWKSRPFQTSLVRYEDLVLKPARTMMRVLSFLELDCTEGEVEAMIRRAQGRARDLLHGHRTSRNPESSIGRWRQELPPSLLEACQEAFEGIQEKFGYIDSPGETS